MNMYSFPVLPRDAVMAVPARVNPRHININRFSPLCLLKISMLPDSMSITIMIKMQKNHVFATMFAFVSHCQDS